MNPWEEDIMSLKHNYRLKRIVILFNTDFKHKPFVTHSRRVNPSIKNSNFLDILNNLHTSWWWCWLLSLQSQLMLGNSSRWLQQKLAFATCSVVWVWFLLWDHMFGLESSDDQCTTQALLPDQDLIQNVLFLFTLSLPYSQTFHVVECSS